MNGKNRCRILKDIRKKIAEENDIEYITTECKYKGDCPGTCPKCESEVRYLERELERKRGLGKRVAIAGIAVGVTATATGCTSDIFSVFKDDTLMGEPTEYQSNKVAEYSQNENSIKNESGVSEVVTDGELVEIIGEMPESSIDEPTAGVLPPDDESLPEITNPYGGIQGMFRAFPFTVNDAAEKTAAEVEEELIDWKRIFIEYHWQKNIHYRSKISTIFMSDDGRYIEVYYDEDDFCEKVEIYEEEIMGQEPEIEEPLMGDVAE
jgi:hypothetical protein